MRSSAPGSRRLPDPAAGAEQPHAAGAAGAGDASDQAALLARIQRREREQALDDAVFTARHRVRRRRARQVFWIVLVLTFLGGGVQLAHAPGWGTVTLGGIGLLVMSAAKLWMDLCPRCRRLIGLSDEPQVPERFCQHCSLPLEEPRPVQAHAKGSDGVR